MLLRGQKLLNYVQTLMKGIKILMLAALSP